MIFIDSIDKLGFDGHFEVERTELLLKQIQRLVCFADQALNFCSKAIRALKLQPLTQANCLQTLLSTIERLGQIPCAIDQLRALE